MAYIVCVIAVMYVLFSLGNGSFDFTSWVAVSREMMAAFDGLFTFVIVVIQFFRARGAL